MTTYARKENGRIVEVFPPAFYDIDVFTPNLEDPDAAPILVHKEGDEIPIEERFHPDFVAQLEVVPDGTQPTPAPQVQLSAAELLTVAKQTRDALLAQAAIRIAPLQDAVDLGEATAAESALLLQWKQYRIAVNRAALEPQPITWPIPPEAQ